MKGYLVFDIETVLHPAMPAWTPRDGRPDALPPPPFWMVVCIGACWITLEFEPRSISTMRGATEAEMVENFARVCDQYQPTFVTMNGRGFDLPVLVAASMRHGIAFPYAFGRDVNYRYGTEGHLDIADFLSLFGAGRMGSLDAWSRSVGFPGKLDVGGSDVAGLMAEGKLDDVKQYCLGDVASTAALFLRTQLMRGKIDQKVYDSRAWMLLELLRKTPELAELRSKVDESKFVPRLERPKDWTDDASAA